MSHKYLEELALSDDARFFLDDSWEHNTERREKWAAEREKYGFDSRETWGLREAFYLWLYERLRMFTDCAAGIIRLDYHTFEYKGQSYKQSEIIDMMLERIRLYFSPNFSESSEEHAGKVNEIAELWSLVLPVMWW